MSNRIEEAVKDYFDGDSVTVHRSCNPNRLGDIALAEVNGEYWIVYHDVLIGYEDSEVQIFDFSTRADAEKVYEEIMNEQHETPNWQAQAEYDEIWGPNVNTYHFEY